MTNVSQNNFFFYSLVLFFFFSFFLQSRIASQSEIRGGEGKTPRQELKIQVNFPQHQLFHIMFFFLVSKEEILLVIHAITRSEKGEENI